MYDVLKKTDSIIKTASWKDSNIFSWKKKLSFEALDFKFVEQNTISNGTPTTETHVKFWNNMSCSPNLKAIAKWIWINIRKCNFKKCQITIPQNMGTSRDVYGYTVVFMNITKILHLFDKGFHTYLSGFKEKKIAKCPKDFFCAFLGPYSIDKNSKVKE